MNLPSLHPSIVGLAAFLSLLFVSASAQTFTTNFPDGSKQVIAHEEPHGLPDYWRWDANDTYNYYREEFPLEMRKYGASDPPRVNRAQRLKDVGLTSLHVLRYDGDACDFTSEFDRIDQAGGGVTVAPCMDVTSEDELVRQLTQYATSSAGRAGAQRITVGGVDKLVISTYWTPSVSMQGWQNARTRLSNAGINLFIIADYAPWGLEHVGRTDWDQWAPLFESYYFFGSPSAAQFTTAVQRMNQISKPYAGGMMPGTGRETDEIAAFFDAQGTAFFRTNWEKHLAANVRWNLINTWNDRAEYTEIRPTSTWNWTRADLNRWYSVKLCGSAKPVTEAKLYITTPQHLHPGESAPVEALVINWSSSPATASVQLLDNNGTPIGSPTTATIAGNSVGTAQLTVTRSTVPAGRFLRARASMGATTVTSAPIIIGSQSTYAIPAPLNYPCSTVTWTCPANNSFTPRGFYVGRVIDENERVGYSDPVYVDQGGLTAAENFIRAKGAAFKPDGGELAYYTVQGRRVAIRTIHGGVRLRGSRMVEGRYAANGRDGLRLIYQLRRGL